VNTSCPSKPLAMKDEAVVRSGSATAESSCGGVRRQNPAWCKAVRSSRRATHEIRAHYKSQNREGTRPPNAAQTPRSGRRGDRMKGFFAAVHGSVNGPSLQILRWNLMSAFGELRTSREADTPNESVANDPYAASYDVRSRSASHPAA
jgi:hypothetical protein